MKKRFAVLALVFSLILSLASTAFAYSVPSDTVVYVTPTGECYHLYNCSYIKDSYSSLYISDAEAYGYRPCSRCDPNIATGVYEWSDEESWSSSGGDGSRGSSNSSKSQTGAEKQTWWQGLLEVLWALFCIVLNIFLVPVVIGVPIMLIEKAVKEIRKIIR